MFKKLKKVIKNFLEDMAKENQESFGTGKIDCCDLNRRNSNTKK